MTTNPPLFSLIEDDNYYLVAVDLPTLPSTDNQIRVSDDELSVEGWLDGGHEKTKLLSCLSQGHHVKAIYEKGVLWLTLPKNNIPKVKPVLAAV